MSRKERGVGIAALVVLLVTVPVIVPDVVGSCPVNAVVKVRAQTIAIPSEGSDSQREPLLAMTLADFEASSRVDHVLVTWKTAREVNNQGFNLWRGSAAGASSQQLNSSLIMSQVSGQASSANYEFRDYDVATGQTYYYWLESVDIHGATQLYGPMSATFQAPTAVSLSQLQASSGSGSAIPIWFVLAVIFATVASYALRQRPHL